jgi:ubiquinone biosynthesis monooxygenase Coq6
MHVEQLYWAFIPHYSIYPLTPVFQVWEACSEAMITFSHDGMVEDIAYIVENDVLLAAVNRQIQELTGNLTVIHQAKIKGYELPQRYGTANDVRVHLENGSTYISSLLVSIKG